MLGDSFDSIRISRFTLGMEQGLLLARFHVTLEIRSRGIGLTVAARVGLQGEVPLDQLRDLAVADALETVRRASALPAEALAAFIGRGMQAYDDCRPRMR